MKKINFLRITWISAIFISLVIILIAVMNYKIYFQYQTKNKIYFYDCNGTLCVTEVEDDNHLLYSKYECGYDDCPIFKSEINDTYVILNNQTNNILFNYRTGDTVSSNYEDYKLLNNNYIIVTKNQKQGIIDLNNKITVSLEYEQLGYIQDEYLMGYNINYIIAKKNNKYGIVSIKNGDIIEKFNHEDNEIETLLNILNAEEKTL